MGQCCGSQDQVSSAHEPLLKGDDWASAQSLVPDSGLTPASVSSEILAFKTSDFGSGKTSGFGSGKIINQYTLCGPILGRGSCGKVIRVCNVEDNKYYAMKIVDKSLLKKRKVILADGSISDHWQNVKREISILRRLRHPCIIRLFEFIDDPLWDTVYIVLEYAVKGSLGEGKLTSEPIDEELCRRYFRDVLAGLDYLHAMGVLHRDLKPENLLLGDDNIVKIADFGVSAEFGESDQMHQSAGTAAFMAPEMCTEKFRSFSGIKADVWALGVTLYVFLFGRLPFVCDNIVDMYDIIVNAGLVIPPVGCEIKISQACESLLRLLMMKDPDHRPTVEEIKTDPWVTLNDTEPMLTCRPQMASSASNISMTDENVWDSDSALGPGKWGTAYGLEKNGSFCQPHDKTAPSGAAEFPGKRRAMSDSFNVNIKSKVSPGRRGSFN